MRTALLAALMLSLLAPAWRGGAALAQGVERPKTTVVPVVDLVLEGPRTAEAGAAVVFLLRGNIAGFPVTNVSLTAELPAGLDFRSASEPGVYNPASRSVVWEFASREEGTFEVEVDALVAVPVRNENRLIVQAVLDTAETEPITAQRTTIAQSEPALEAAAAFATVEVKPGELVSLMVRIQNNGSDQADDVIVQADLPDGLAMAVSKEKGIDERVGAIPAGQSYDAALQIAVDPAAVPGERMIRFTVSSANHAALTAEALLTIQPIPPLEQAPAVPPPSAPSQPRGQVLGASTELPETGISFGDWLLIALAAFLLTAGITTFAFYPFPPRSRG